MFQNLKVEMTRNNIQLKDMAKEIGLSYDALKNRFNGRTSFKRKELFLIKEKFFKNCSIEYLFEEHEKTG